MMPPVGAQNWQQFSPNSPSYLGAQGIGVPPWMQNRLGGGVTQGADQSTGVGPIQSGDPSMTGGTANTSSNAQPQWFTDFVNQQNAANSSPVNPAQPPATAMPPAPTTQPDMGAAPAPAPTYAPPVAPSSASLPTPAASNSQQGIGLSQSPQTPAPSPGAAQTTISNPPIPPIPNQPSVPGANAVTPNVDASSSVLGEPAKMARGGAVRGYADGGEVNHPMGLVHAARQLESYGRGPDTSLAHISPDESKMLDYLQGGRKTNPATGLPEYSLFGDILKAVARVGATAVGFMYGGPAGAAAGSAIATKLTGGSWKDAAISGGLSGLTAGIGNVASGSGLMSSGNSIAAGEFADVANPSIGQTLTNAVKYVGTTPGLAMAATQAAGVLGQPTATSGPPPGWQGPTAQIPSTYDPKNLPSWYAPGAKKAANTPQEAVAADDGAPLDPNDPDYASKMSLRYAGAPAMAGGGPVGMGAPPEALLQAANWGYVNAKGGGVIRGPGGPTDDEVPALLSNQEHVVDVQTIGDLAKISGHPGNLDAGQEAMEKIKQTIRRAAGRKNPKSPTSPMKAA